MEDRKSLHPGRVKLIPVDVANGIYDMVMADEPVQVGTPLNKETLLSDETAEQLAISDPQARTVNNALVSLDESITALSEDMNVQVGNVLNQVDEVLMEVRGETLHTSGGVMYGDINMSGVNTITQLKLPTNSTDAANKKYVDDNIASNKVNTSNFATKTDMNVAITAANSATTVANAAKTTAEAALPKSGGVMNGKLVMGTEGIIQSASAYSGGEVWIGNSQSSSTTTGNIQISFHARNTAYTLSPVYLKGITMATSPANTDGANVNYVNNVVSAGVYTGNGKTTQTISLGNLRSPKAVFVERETGKRSGIEDETGGLAVGRYPLKADDAYTDHLSIGGYGFSVYNNLNISGVLYYYVALA